MVKTSTKVLRFDSKEERNAKFAAMRGTKGLAKFSNPELVTLEDGTRVWRDAWFVTYVE